METIGRLRGCFTSVLPVEQSLLFLPDIVWTQAKDLPPNSEIGWLVKEHSVLAFTRVELFNQRGHGVGDGVSCHQEIVPQVPSGT